MSQEKPDDKNIDDKNIVDKAKEAASDVKEKVTGGDGEAGVVDKAKEAAAGARERVSGFVGEHEEQIHGAIDKTGEFVDDRVTRHRFSDRVRRASDSLKGTVSKIGGRSDKTEKKKSTKSQKSQTSQTKQQSAKGETKQTEEGQK
jgi:hypothetical protein